MDATTVDACSFSFQGKIQDRIGFFPANFVQRVQQNEKIFRCVRTFIGCKEQGQITLKENQVSKAHTRQIHDQDRISHFNWAVHIKLNEWGPVQSIHLEKRYSYSARMTQCGSIWTGKTEMIGSSLGGICSQEGMYITYGGRERTSGPRVSLWGPLVCDVGSCPVWTLVNGQAET